MITETYQYIASDSYLCELLNHNPYQKSVKIFFGRPQSIYPHQVNEKGSFIDSPYIVYDVTTLTQSVLTSEYRIKVTLVVDDELKLKHITKRLIEILDFNKANVERPTNRIEGTTILHSQLLTGGNFLFHEEEKLFEQTQYFLVKVKG